MVETTIQTLVVEAVIARLEDKLQVPFSSDDETRLNEIGVGKLQKNPYERGVYMMMRPSTETERHGLDDQDPYMKAPIGLVGGINQAFYRNRHTIEVGMFFRDKVSFKESLSQSNLVLARMKYALMTMNQVQGTDSFGESMWHRPIVYSTFIEESGARTGTNNYRGEVLFDIYTQFSPVDEEG